MSLIEMSLKGVVKRQYMLKMRAFTRVFSSLVFVHLIAMLFSIGGVGSTGGGSSLGISYQFSYMSGDMIYIFTLVWAFVIPFGMVRREHWEMDYAFITNRLASQLANIAFMVTMSAVAAIMAVGSSILFKTLTALLSSELMVATSFGLLEYVISMAVLFMYLLLLSSVGYTLALIMKWYGLFKIIIPVTVVGLLLVEQRVGFFGGIFPFYALEDSIIVLLIKSIGTAGVLFVLMILLTNRWEARV
ncbi:hypothetical protein [Alkalibacillus aidingensis]|uniref:hypothetical protein n=1 Tax=Alkalibacillus aidingensis TaxID=2747607 RepID=UPI0016604AFD|nr:hypothetical protein [Alkalibacillus aidingensis]